MESVGSDEKEGRQSDAEWREHVGLPVLEATVRGQGIDYVRNDPDGGRMRLDAGLVVEDEEGAVSASAFFFSVVVVRLAGLNIGS